MIWKVNSSLFSQKNLAWHNKICLIFYSSENLARDSLPMLQYMSKHGNTTVYEWRTGSTPSRVEELPQIFPVDDEPEEKATQDAELEVTWWECLLNPLGAKPKYSGKPRSIPLLLMPWLLVIDHVGKAGPCVMLGTVSTTCAISLLRNDRKCESIFMYIRIKSACQRLSVSLFFLFQIDWGNLDDEGIDFGEGGESGDIDWVSFNNAPLTLTLCNPQYLMYPIYILYTHWSWNLLSIPIYNIFTIGQFGHSGIVIVFVCMCVCVCVNPKFVCAINHQQFKLEPPKPDKRCKTPWLSSLLFGVNWPWPLRSNLTEKSKFTPFRACPPLLWCQIQMSVSSLSTRVLVSLICEYPNEDPFYPWIKYYFAFNFFRV